MGKGLHSKREVLVKEGVGDEKLRIFHEARQTGRIDFAGREGKPTRDMKQ